MIIGITGRVGSGKTTAQEIFIQRTGYTCFDLDIIGHELLQNPDMIQTLVSTFGESILDESEKISRNKLGDLVFSNPNALMNLNQIMHPKINQYVKDHLTESGIIVGALIKEIGLRNLCDILINIDAEDGLIREKIGEKFEKIAPLQASRQAYNDDADITITNTFSPSFISDCESVLASLKKG